MASGPVQHEGFRVTLDEALDVFELRWAENDDWYEDKAKHDEYHAKGRSAVRRMVESWLTSPPDAVHLEKTFLWQFGDLSIGGKIDRMDKAADGSFVLFDYKTGSPKTSLTPFQRAIQMSSGTPSEPSSSMLTKSRMVESALPYTPDA